MDSLPSLPGHHWRYSPTAVDPAAHQYPVDAAPDDEGLVEAACAQPALAVRLLPAAPWQVACPVCLIEAMTAERTTLSGEPQAGE